MASVSFPSQTLTSILRADSLSRPSPSARRLPGIHRYNCPRRKTSTFHWTRRTSPWTPLSAAKPPPLGGDAIPLPPQSELLHRFYSSINEKDLSGLEKLCSKDCFFDHLAYSKPLDRERMTRFFKDLTHGMGPHVRFVIDGVYEGKELTASVMWHLEWKDKFLPFSKGCSFFKCSEDGELLLIEEARVFIELPLKPGDLVIGTLRIAVSLFDYFPKTAERFLKRPEKVAHFVGTIYKVFVKPMMFPVFAYYTNFWAYVGRARGSIESIIKKIYGFMLKIICIIIQRILK